MTQYGIRKMGLLDRFLNWIGLRPTKKEKVAEGVAKLYRELSTEGGTTEARYPERDYGPIPIVPASRLKMNPSPEVPSEVASEVSEAPPNASEVPEVSNSDNSDNSDRPTRTNPDELGPTRTTESELKVALKATESELKVTESAPFQVDIYRERRKS